MWVAVWIDNHFISSDCLDSSSRIRSGVPVNTTTDEKQKQSPCQEEKGGVRGAVHVYGPPCVDFCQEKKNMRRNQVSEAIEKRLAKGLDMCIIDNAVLSSKYQYVRSYSSTSTNSFREGLDQEEDKKRFTDTQAWQEEKSCFDIFLLRKLEAKPIN